jgi:hypothetical protein
MNRLPLSLSLSLSVSLRCKQLFYGDTITGDISGVRRLSHIYIYCPQRSLN